MMAAEKSAWLRMFSPAASGWGAAAARAAQSSTGLSQRRGSSIQSSGQCRSFSKPARACRRVQAWLTSTASSSPGSRVAKASSRLAASLCSEKPILIFEAAVAFGTGAPDGFGDAGVVDAAGVDRHGAVTAAAQETVQGTARTAGGQIPQGDVRAASAWDMGPGSSACRRRTSSCPATSAERAAGLLQALPMTLGRMAVSSRRALCSAPQEGKLHQASPQPCVPSSSSRRSRTAGLSCMMPNEVRTAFSMGALKTAISAERTGAIARSVVMVFPLLMWKKMISNWYIDTIHSINMMSTAGGAFFMKFFRTQGGRTKKKKAAQRQP